METRKIGSLEVSVLGLGCNDFGMTLDKEASSRVIHAALDAGITYFDTADVYGNGDSERILGSVLSSRRGDVVVSTKFGAPTSPPAGVSPGDPKWLHQAVEGSLERLGVDCIDHYELHYYDPTTPLEVTLEALDGLVRQGKVREIGCSNFSAAQLLEARAVSSAAGYASFSSVQNRYNVLHRAPEQDGTLDACADDVAFIPFFPLELGILTGKYKVNEPPPADSRRARWNPNITDRYFEDHKVATAAKLAEYARERGRTSVELALSWLLAKRQVGVVVAGSSKPEHVVMNSQSLGWRMSDTELADIDRIVAQRDVTSPPDVLA